MSDQSFPGNFDENQGFGFRHTKTDTLPNGERIVSNVGRELAEQRARSEEVSRLIDQAPPGAVIFLGGASDAIRTHETGEAIGNTLADVYVDRTDIHVIPPHEIRAFTEVAGSRAETIRQIQTVIADRPSQKVVITYPFTLKELSPNAPVEGVPGESRWRVGGKEAEFTGYTKFLLAKGKENPPDGDLREWFKNKGVVEGQKVGPAPEEVAQAYLKAFDRLKAFVTKQVADRPVVVGLVGHSWDLDALAVYLGNNGVIDEAGYDRVRGTGHMVKETELLQFSIDHGQATLNYRGQAVTVPSASVEAAEETSEESRS